MLTRLLFGPTVSTWSSFAVKALTPFIILPFVLSAYDAEHVALWLLFSSIGSLSAIMDFGLQQTTARLVSYKVPLVQRGLPETVNPQFDNTSTTVGLQGLLVSAHKVYFRLGVGVAIVFAFIGALALRPAIDAAGGAFSIWAAWAMIPLGLGVQLAHNHFTALFVGTRNIPVLKGLEVVVGGLVLAMSIAVVQLRLPYALLLVMVPLSQLLMVFGLRGLAAKLFSADVYQSARGVSASEKTMPLAEIWRPAWRSGLGMLASLGLFHVASIAYGSWLPADQAAPYLLAFRLVLAISVLAQAPFYTQIPRYGALWVEGNLSEIARDAAHRMRLSYGVFVTGSLILGGFGEQILGAIGSTTGFVPVAWWSCLTMALLIERWGAMHLQLYSLSNHIVWHKANGVTALLVIGVAAGFMEIAGVYAYPAALLFGNMVFYTPYCTRLSYRLFQVSNPFAYEMKAVIPFLLVLALTFTALIYR